MIIARIELLYATKGMSQKSECSISIVKPLLVDNDRDHKPNRLGFYFSKVIVSPLEDLSFYVYGANAIQAVHIASDIEFIIKKISKDYDFFYMDSEPYSLE